MAEQLDRLLTQQQVVDWIGMSPAWFEMARFKGTGIPYIKIGRSVRYRTKDVQQYLDAHLVGSGI